MSMKGGCVIRLRGTERGTQLFPLCLEMEEEENNVENLHPHHPYALFPPSPVCLEKQQKAPPPALLRHLCPVSTRGHPVLLHSLCRGLNTCPHPPQPCKVRLGQCSLCILLLVTYDALDCSVGPPLLVPSVCLIHFIYLLF